MKRKIIYVSGSRADYGLMRSVLKRIQNHSELDLHIVATGMHLMPEFGNTYKEILQDGFTYHQVEATYLYDTNESMASFIGDFIKKFTQLVTKIKPDFILVLGDRGEMLGGAIVGTYLGIVVVHIHGGEITETIDEIARHAITKLSHLHLTATRESADRIIRMGEDPARVHIVGAPGLDQIRDIDFLPPDELSRKFNLDLSLPIILVLQHPVTLDEGIPEVQIFETLKAIDELEEQSIIIFPNADAGGRSMIEEIKKFSKSSRIRIYPNISHRDFLSILRIAAVLVGNSSAGIIEAPSFGIPVVNIGSRQKGRQKSENVIDSGYKMEEIKKAIRFALYDENFKCRIKNISNPYGDGRASERIVDILKKTKISPDLLKKRMLY